MRGVAGVLALAVVLAARPAAAGAADPVRDAARNTVVQHAADRARAGLERVATELEAAIDAGRRGAALVVSGERPPEPPLVAAARALEAARPASREASERLDTLRGLLRATDPAAQLPPLGVAGDDLASIASQLRASAEAATEFVERRQAATTTLEALGRALAALDASQPRAALRAVADAGAAHDLVADWEAPPPELAYWLDTTQLMIGAAKRMATGVLDGDRPAVRKAVRDYRAAAERAGPADRALALSIAEAGSAITRTPLERLAAAAAATVEAQAGVASILD